MATETTLDVLFTPADFATLKHRDLTASVCIVFDVLRATTTMLTALSNGAEAIVPVEEISEAISLREADPSILLAGEREGLRITGAQTGGIEFDLGNSPREFLPKIVRGKRIVMTTTNGTRALKACAGARRVFIGSFLNLRPLAEWLKAHRPASVFLVCSGTYEQAALEDTLAVGALCEKIWPYYASGQVGDSAEIARRLYPLMQQDLLGAMRHARNGRRLLANPTLQKDVAFCLQRGVLDIIGEMKFGEVRIAGSAKNNKSV
jgi:2-phosphosulfolactate phosphatase